MIERIINTDLKGCFEIQIKVFRDERGLFVKTFNEQAFSEYGLETYFPETVYSVSEKFALRGLHFQKVPAAHTKVISCVSGKIQDVVVDLRNDSNTFGMYSSFHLEAGDGKLVYIPKGMAHGFLSLEKNSIVCYKTSTMYSPENDSGVHYNSCGIKWDTQDALIVSEKDRNMPPFDHRIKYF